VQDGKAVRREVTLGDMTGDRIEVLQGLEPDDEIVVAGIMNIADGTEVIIQK
jgi:multidrug efflux pump subunit AcrA (membrane-fusion protein)